MNDIKEKLESVKNWDGNYPFPEELEYLVRTNPIVAKMYGLYQNNDDMTMEEMLLLCVWYLAERNRELMDKLIDIDMSKPTVIKVDDD